VTDASVLGMSSDPKTKSQPAAKAGQARRDRLAAELRSNLHKRKARARAVGQPKNAEPEPPRDPE
jgi:hypothetical protein